MSKRSAFYQIAGVTLGAGMALWVLDLYRKDTRRPGVDQGDQISDDARPKVEDIKRSVHGRGSEIAEKLKDISPPPITGTVAEQAQKLRDHADHKRQEEQEKGTSWFKWGADKAHDAAQATGASKEQEVSLAHQKADELKRDLLRQAAAGKQPGGEKK
jgi:hypothetical protein